MTEEEKIEIIQPPRRKKKGPGLGTLLACPKCLCNTCLCKIPKCCCGLVKGFNQFLFGKKEGLGRSYKPCRFPTDFCCIFLFAFYWMGMIVVSGIAFTKGNPRTLLLPTDRMNNICGEENTELGTNILRDLRKLPYLWYPFQINVADPVESRLFDALDMGICVETCPTVSMITPNIDFSSVSSITNFGMDAIICEYDYQSLSNSDKAEAVKNGTYCYINWLPTTLMHHRCIPNFEEAPLLSDFYKTLMSYTIKTGNAVKTGMYELQASWVLLSFLVIIMTIVCYAFLCIVQIFIKAFVYTTLFGIMFLLGTVCFYFGWIGARKYKTYEDEGYADSAQRNWAIVWWIFCGVFALAEILYVCLMVFLMNRISIAITIIQYAVEPIKRVPWVVCLPPLKFGVALVFTIYFVVVAAYIQSSKTGITLSGSELSTLQTYTNVTVTGDTYTLLSADTTTQGFLYYNLFGYFWTISFIMAFGYTVVAGVIAAWYFSNPGDSKNPGCFPVIRSFLRVSIYHTGSVLFGSLLVAIVKMIRVMLKRVKQYVEKTTGKNKVTGCIFRVLKVAIWLLEKIIKFINKNAYIMMMIHGQCFMTSSSRAIMLILINILQIGLVNFIGDFMLFLSQIGLTIVGGIVTYFLIDVANDVDFMNWMIYLAETQSVTDSEGNVVDMYQLQYSVVTLFAGIVISFIVSGLYTNLYETSIDTILLCFCEDRWINDGSPDRPYFMPERLRVKIRKGNKAMVGKKK